MTSTVSSGSSGIAAAESVSGKPPRPDRAESNLSTPLRPVGADAADAPSSAGPSIWNSLHIPQDVQNTAKGIGQVVGAVSSAISWVGTVQSVLQLAGFLSPAPNPFDTLYERLQKDLRTLLTATLAGATEERLRDVAEQGAIARTAAQHGNEYILNGRPTDQFSIPKLVDADVTSKTTMNVLSDPAWWDRTYDPSVAAVYGPSLPGPKVFGTSGGGGIWPYQTWAQPPSGGLIWDYRHILPVYLRALAARIIVLKARAADGNEFQKIAETDLRGYIEFLTQQHDRINGAIRVTPAPAPHQGQFPAFVFNCGAVETYTGTHVWGGLHPMYVDIDEPLETYAEHVEVWDKVVADCRYRLYEGIGLGALKQLISAVEQMLVAPCGVSTATVTSASAALIGCAGVEPTSHVFVPAKYQPPAPTGLRVAWKPNGHQPWRWHNAGLPPGAQHISAFQPPAVTSFGDGAGRRIHAFCLGFGGRLYVYWWDGGRWHWADQGQPPNTALSYPAATAFAAGGRQQLRAYAIDKTVWANWWDGTRWQWVDLGKPATGAVDLKITPTVLSYRWQGRMIDDLYMNAGGDLWEHIWNEDGSRSWSRPAAQPKMPRVYGSPAAVMHEEDGQPFVRVFVTSDNGGTLASLEWRGGWHWVDHGRPPGNEPISMSPNGQPVKATVLRLPPGSGWPEIWTVAVVRGVNGRLYARKLVSGGQWSWQDLRTPPGTTVTDILGATSYVKSGGFVGIDIYARSADNRIWRTGIAFDNSWDEIGVPA